MTPSEESLAKLPAEGAQLYEGLRQYLLEIDSNLVRLDKILSRLQPPVSGRVRLAWRKDGSSLLTERRPILVQWKKVGEKWTYERMGDKSLVQKLPRSGAFYFVREELRETTRQISVLLNKRSVVIETVRRTQQAIRFLVEKNQESMRQTGTEIDALEDRAAMLPCTWRDGQQVGEGTKETLVADLTDEEAQALFDSL